MSWDWVGAGIGGPRWLKIFWNPLKKGIPQGKGFVFAQKDDQLIRSSRRN